MEKKKATDKDKELLLQYHSNQDPELRDQIITRYLPLVHYTLGRLGISSEIGPDYEDMASQGLLGLIDAVDRYDPQFGTQFSTYAVIKVRGKILDYLRSMDWLSRTARRRAKLINDAIDTFWEKNQRMPSDDEIAQALDLDVSQVQTAMAASSRVIVSFDSFNDLDNDDDYSLHETLADNNQPDPADIIDEQEIKSRLIGALKQIPEREQLLLSLYYYEKLTFKEIGEVLEVSESRVCQLHARATLHLKTILASDESLQSPRKKETKNKSRRIKNTDAKTSSVQTDRRI